jgi:hypothetical protein
MLDYWWLEIYGIFWLVFLVITLKFWQQQRLHWTWLKFLLTYTFVVLGITFREFQGLSITTVVFSRRGLYLPSAVLALP